MKKCLLTLAVGLILAVLFGCPPPEPPATGGGTISGTVTDAVTGAPIGGVTVCFGSYSDDTDGAGEYSIVVPTSVTSVTGSFAAYKGLEYAFRACGGIAVNPTTDPVYDFDLYPYDTSGYSEVTLSGRIYDNTGAELEDWSEVFFYFSNGNGGRFWTSASYEPATGYTVSTPTNGTNCFMYVQTPGFAFYQTGKNLSADLTDHDLTQPAAGSYDSITLNGETGTIIMGGLVLPTSVVLTSYIGGIMLAPTANLDVYNPQDYPLQWYVMTVEMDTPVAGAATVRGTIETTPFSSSINLPAAYAGSVPTALVSAATVTWSGSTLSFAPTTGANSYMVVINDNDGHCGSIQMGTGASVTFPSGLVTSVLTPGAGWDLVAWPMYSTAFTPNWTLKYSLLTHPQGEVAERAMPSDMEGGFGMIQTGGVTKADAIP